MPISTTLLPLAVQPGAPVNQLHLWPERMLGYLSTTTISIYDSTILLVTLGAPYLQYKLYGSNGNTPPSSENYSLMVEELEMLWNRNYDFLLPILPTLFPMISLSGLSTCSVASFAAKITLTAGAASIGTKIIFQGHVNALHNERVIKQWRGASGKSWRKVRNKSFWVLFSLPTVFFFLSDLLFFSTIVLTIMERPIVGLPSSLEIQGCTSERFQAFKYTLFAVLVAIVTHFSFVIIKLRSLTASQTIDSTSAA